MTRIEAEQLVSAWQANGRGGNPPGSAVILAALEKEGWKKAEAATLVSQLERTASPAADKILIKALSAERAGRKRRMS